MTVNEFWWKYGDGKTPAPEQEEWTTLLLQVAARISAQGHAGGKSTFWKVAEKFAHAQI